MGRFARGSKIAYSFGGKSHLKIKNWLVTYCAQVGYADDTVEVFSPMTGDKLWSGSAMGTAAGAIVRDFLALASDSAVHIICWTLKGSTSKEIPVANGVMCRHGSLLAVANVEGSMVKCRLVDVMTPDLQTKDLFSVPLSVGYPLLMASDTTNDGRIYTRIICSNGIHVYHPAGMTTIPGEYSKLQLISNACLSVPDSSCRRVWDFCEQGRQCPVDCIAGDARG